MTHEIFKQRSYRYLIAHSIQRNISSGLLAQVSSIIHDIISSKSSSYMTLSKIITPRVTPNNDPQTSTPNICNSCPLLILSRTAKINSSKHLAPEAAVHNSALLPLVHPHPHQQAQAYPASLTYSAVSDCHTSEDGIHLVVAGSLDSAGEQVPG